VVDRPTVDDLQDPLQVFVGIVYVADLNLLFVDEHAQVLADQLGRPVAGSRVAAARRQYGVGAQPAHDPEVIEAGFFGR
jgi:hypothetical protein